MRQSPGLLLDGVGGQGASVKRACTLEGWRLIRIAWGDEDVNDQRAGVPARARLCADMWRVVVMGGRIGEFAEPVKQKGRISRSDPSN
jgi:hypothetical protein